MLGEQYKLFIIFSSFVFKIHIPRLRYKENSISYEPAEGAQLATKHSKAINTFPYNSKLFSL